MLVHRFTGVGGWAAFSALALSCACGTGGKLPAANGGMQHDAGAGTGSAAHAGQSGKAGAGTSGGSAGRSGSGGSVGAAAGGGGGGSTAGSGGSSGACGAGCAGGGGSVEGGEWPNADCTFGQDQTCNDNLAMSSYAGTCSKTGTCFCMPGFAIRLATAKCAAYTPQPGDPCPRNPACNDDPMSAARTGLCLTDGSCYCLSNAVKNPETGLCKLR